MSHMYVSDVAELPHDELVLMYAAAVQTDSMSYDGEDHPIAEDISRRLMVHRLTACREFSSNRYFPHVSLLSDFLHATCGSRNYDLFYRQAALDSGKHVRRRRPPLEIGIMTNVYAHFLEQTAVTNGAIPGEPAPVEHLDDGQLIVVHVCLSTDGVGLTPALGYVPSFGMLGLTPKALVTLEVDTMADAFEKISGMAQQSLHELCKKTGVLVRNGMATLCRRSDNACQSVVALNLTGNGGSAEACLDDMKEEVRLLRDKCGACHANSRECVRRCDNGCDDYCDGCHACAYCSENKLVCKRITIDTISMDCASAQWGAMQIGGASEQLGLNAGFVPDVGHVVSVSGTDKRRTGIGTTMTSWRLNKLTLAHSLQVKNAVDGLRRGYILTRHGAVSLHMLRVIIEDGMTKGMLPWKLSIHDITGAYRLSHASVERIMHAAEHLGKGPMVVTKTDGFADCTVLAISPALGSVLFCPAANDTTRVTVISKRTATARSSWTLDFIVQGACFVDHLLVLLTSTGECLQMDAAGLAEAGFVASPVTRMALRFNTEGVCDTRIISVASDGKVLLLGTKSGVFHVRNDEADLVGERRAVRALAAGCGRLAVCYANRCLQIQNLDSCEPSVKSVVLPAAQMRGLKLAVCENGVAYVAGGELHFVEPSAHSELTTTCLVQKRKAMKDGIIPGACVRSLTTITSAFGQVEFIDDGCLRFMCWREGLARLLCSIRALYESAGLHEMSGTLLMPSALETVEKLQVYNTHVEELDQMQQDRLGSISGQGEVAALSKVARLAPTALSARAGRRPSHRRGERGVLL